MKKKFSFTRDELIKEIRTTLKARIIPNLPLEPKYLRRDIEDIIDKFEFEWYFESAVQWLLKEIEKERVETENIIEEDKYDTAYKNAYLNALDVFQLLDRIEGRTNQTIQQRVEQLLKEIRELDFEMQFGKNWRKHEWARTQDFADFVMKIIYLIKKAFSGMVEE